MSSKSKNKSPQAEVEQEVVEHAEEVIHVPKGTSPLRFILMVGLVIVLLIIFAIPSAMFGAAGRGGGGSEVLVSWAIPGKEPRELTALQFQEELRDWTSFYDILFGGQAPRLTNDQMAGILILGDLAEDAGVRIPDSEVTRFLRDYVLPGFGGAANYKAYMDRRRGYSPKTFEETLRRHLRHTTYLMLMGYLGGRPSSDDVVEAWQEQHVEAQWDFVQVPVANFVDAARSFLPGDDELQAWLEALSPMEASAYRQPQRTALEQLRFSMDADSSALLAAYPRPEDEDPEVRAREYYDAVRFGRFRNPLPEGADDETRRTWKFYPEYEELAEEALAEAAIWFSLGDLRADLERRQAEGEELDLASIAALYGLEYAPAGEPWTSEQWTDDEAWGGAHLGRTLAMVQQGGFSPEPVWDGDAFVFARVAERTDPALELEPVRAEVEEAWVAERAQQMAMDVLNGLRDGLRPEGEVLETVEADAATFLAAAENAGFPAQTTEWIDTADRSVLPPDAPTVRLFLRSGPYATLEPGQVAEPGTAGDPKLAFLVRAAGKRPADVSAMKPGDYPRFVSNASAERNMDFALENMGLAPSGPIPNFSRDVLELQFGLRMKKEQGEEDAEAEGTPE